MLSYLPEKVYETIKNNKDYALLADELTEQMFGKDDNICFVQSLMDYVSENPIVKKLQEESYKMVDKKYHKLLEISFSDNFIYDEENFKNAPIEMKLYGLYVEENGDTTLTYDFEKRVEKFLNLYNTISNKDEVSEFIHIIKYTYVLFDKMMKIRDNYPYSKEDINEWLKVEEKEYNELKELLGDCSDSVKNILYHKRIQMMTIFFELFVQFVIRYDDYELIELFESNIDIKDFKYNDFNWFKILFNQICFQFFIDNADYVNALKYFSNVYNLIEYSFNNRRYAMKSLNHFNKAFLGEYLGFVRYLYVFIERLLPSIRKFFIENINKLGDLDKKFIFNDLNDSERVKIYELINLDAPYSINWALSNKSKITLLNQIILDNQE